MWRQKHLRCVWGSYSLSRIRFSAHCGSAVTGRILSPQAVDLHLSIVQGPSTSYLYLSVELSLEASGIGMWFLHPYSFFRILFYFLQNLKISKVPSLTSSLKIENIYHLRSSRIFMKWHTRLVSAFDILLGSPPKQSSKLFVERLKWLCFGEFGKLHCPLSSFMTARRGR